MSTDLEFPQIRLPLQLRSISDANNNNIPNSSSAADVCRTPTSADHKIPKIIRCPGAPRKPKRPPVPCKRKLTMELKFFEIVHQEEVDNFFRSAYDLDSSSAPPKRTCCRSA